MPSYLQKSKKSNPSNPTQTPDEQLEGTDGILARELRQLQEVRETLLALPCSPKIEPIVAQLSEILDLAHDGGGIDVERLQILSSAARKETTM